MSLLHALSSNIQRFGTNKLVSLQVQQIRKMPLISSFSLKDTAFSTDSNMEGAGGAMSGGVRFGRAMLTVRGAEGVANSVHFYQQGLGMTIIRHTDEWAELSCQVGKSNSPSDKNDQDIASASPSFRLNLKGVYNEAELTVGYSPFLCFEVDDMDTTITRCIQMGAHLDGPIQYPAHGKVATIRAPDGHMIGLYEPAFS